MRSRLCFITLILLASAAWAQERQLVATLQFEIGAAELTAEHRATLDGVKQQYPPSDYLYYFEGDHDPIPFEIVTPKASKRINEQLAQTRWEAAAQYLGVPPLGLVRATGSTEARVYVERRPSVGMDVAPLARALEDSIAKLRNDLEKLRQSMAEGGGPGRSTAEPETIMAVAQLEELHERSDKWIDRRWWEAQGGFELGILRVQPARPGDPSGATLAVSNGTPAYHALDITTRLDFLRLGNERIGVTPSLRWYDWFIRVHYGQDQETNISFVNRSDPVFLLGADLDAKPWDGGLVRLKYAGFGGRVHAARRPATSYDQFDLRFDQNLWPSWRLELQGVYDERFEKSVCYYGAWIAHGWRMLLGEFAVHLGFVEQLDAFAAARLGREDPVSTISVGFTWERQRRFKY